jgi:Mor family transcriptional regulator
MKEVCMGMNPKDIESEYLNGVYNEIANTLGIEAAVTLYSTYRGQQITFPVNLFTSEFIASRIVAEYDGKNIRQLATKYGYSEKWIRKMIKEHGGREK